MMISKRRGCSLPLKDAGVSLKKPRNHQDAPKAGPLGNGCKIVEAPMSRNADIFADSHIPFFGVSKEDGSAQGLDGRKDVEVVHETPMRDGIDSYDKELSESIWWCEAAAKQLEPVRTEYLGGRDPEIKTLTEYIHKFLAKDRGGGVYINGASGVGKTCVATKVAKDLHATLSVLTDTHAYVTCCNNGQHYQIFNELLGKLCEAKKLVQKQNELKAAYKDDGMEAVVKKFVAALKRRSKLTICILDEVDFLRSPKLGRADATKRSKKPMSTLEYIFKAAFDKDSRIIVIAISNSIEYLPDYSGLQRLVFRPYDEFQLNHIMRKSLEPVNKNDENIFDEAGIKWMTRKIANQSGDCRRCKDCLCRVALSTLGSLRKKQQAYRELHGYLLNSRIANIEKYQIRNTHYSEASNGCAVGELRKQILGNWLSSVEEVECAKGDECNTRITENSLRRPADAYDLDPCKLSQETAPSISTAASYTKKDENDRFEDMAGKSSRDTQYSLLSICSDTTTETYSHSSGSNLIHLVDGIEKCSPRVKCNRLDDLEFERTKYTQPKASMNDAQLSLQSSSTSPLNDQQADESILDPSQDKLRKRQSTPISRTKKPEVNTASNAERFYGGKITETYHEELEKWNDTGSASKTAVMIPGVSKPNKARTFGTVLTTDLSGRLPTPKNAKQTSIPGNEPFHTSNSSINRIGVADLSNQVNNVYQFDKQALISLIDSLTLMQKFHLQALCEAATNKWSNNENMPSNCAASQRVEVDFTEISVYHEKLLARTESAHLLPRAMTGSNFQSALTEFVGRGICKVYMNSASKSTKGALQGGITPRRSAGSRHNVWNQSVELLLPPSLVSEAIGALTNLFGSVNLSDHFNCGLE